MTGLLTCLFLIVLAGLSAEAVRATCRRRLLTPVAPLAALRPNRRRRSASSSTQASPTWRDLPV